MIDLLYKNIDYLQPGDMIYARNSIAHLPVKGFKNPDTTWLLLGVVTDQDGTITLTYFSHAAAFQTTLSAGHAETIVECTVDFK